MKKLNAVLLLFLSSNALAERGVSVDVNGFIEASTDTIMNSGSKIVVAAVVLNAVGLMIPGFREVTRRSLPWTVLGILGIVLATKYWR